MKVASFGVIISCLMSVTSLAQIPSDQQLAEFAREERMRRESQGVVSEGIVSSDNIRRAGFPVFIGRVGTVVPGAPTSSGETAAADVEDGAFGQTEADDPLAALARQQQLVQAMQDEEVRLQLDINRFRAQFQAPVVSERERNEAAEGMTRVTADLESLRVDLAAAIEELAALQEAAAAAALVQ